MDLKKSSHLYRFSTLLFPLNAETGCHVIFGAIMNALMFIMAPLIIGALSLGIGALLIVGPGSNPPDPSLEIVSAGFGMLVLIAIAGFGLHRLHRMLCARVEIVD